MYFINIKKPFTSTNAIISKHD